MDGSPTGDNYGAALSIQNTNTQFGDGQTGDTVEGGGGSELDAFYAKIENGRLYMFVAGNLETNFNKLEFFFDTKSGGQNVINGAMLPTGVDEFSSMGTGQFDGGALQRMTGLTFDAGFEADYYLTMSHGYENALDNPNSPGNPIQFWAASAHFSDMTATAPADRRDVAAGMQLAPAGLPNVLRSSAAPNLSDLPFLPDGITPTIPDGIGPSLPGLSRGQLIDRAYAIGSGGCNSNDTGAGCIATELGFALAQSPSDPTNMLSHRNFNNVIGLQMAVNNSNVAGVSGNGPYTTPTTTDPGAVTTGLEFSIPLSEIGSPNGNFKVVAFVNGGGHHYLSNQIAGDGILGGNLGGDGLGAFCGSLSCTTGSPNFANITGNQFVTIPNASTVDGDFNNDNLWNCSDINALTAAISSGSTDLSFDMNGDNAITFADVTAATVGWLAVGGANNPVATGGDPFLIGDANLDGTVDGQDFIVWNTHKFTSNNAWCSGNFNGDLVVDGQDFIAWNTFKFQSSDSVAAVPEPTSALALLLGMLAGVRRLRK
jgi:hypothetical protein